MASIENDLGVLAAVSGDQTKARHWLNEAMGHDVDCPDARQNLALLDQSMSQAMAEPNREEDAVADGPRSHARPIRVAFLSLLFNWPSTGGGTVHTAEAGLFLSRAGYDVQHIYAKYEPWEIGNVAAPTGVPSVPLEFDASEWDVPTIRRRFRQAVDAFGADNVIITDSWNMKPVLAEAVREYRYFLRLAALECLCPLNNVRLLFERRSGFSACPRQQLATPDVCRRCVSERGQHSGSLHQAERHLAGFGTAEYAESLLRAFAEAEAVLVVNPLIAAMVAPFAKAVHVIPSGFDKGRFPWTPTDDAKSASRRAATRLLFAGVVDEPMKGFVIAQEACARLWSKRQDFELIATADPVGQVDAFTRNVGWLSQEDLPNELRQADILLFPTVAEEALGRSAVEAMGAGRPVIASRIGGLPYTVTDGLTGLLFEPGNVADLAAKIELLLDDPPRRVKMGQAGRERFEAEFTWETVIERHYRRLLRSDADTAAPVPPPPPIESDHYKPVFLERVDHGRLVGEAAEFFRLPRGNVERMFQAYREYYEAQGYERTLGEWKTLTFEETFLLALPLSLTRPGVVVEIGTCEGKSSRRIIDLISYLGLESNFIGYDFANQLRYATPEEMDFRAEDLTGRFRTEILDRQPEGMIFLDTHGYDLVREVVHETINHFGNWTLAIHDCGRGLCNPRMTIPPDDPQQVTSLTGVWERYILAETFEIQDPASASLDFHETPIRRMRIFDTQHGLALILPSAGETTHAESASRLLSRSGSP